MNLENVHYLNMFLGAGAIMLQIFSLAALFVLFLGPKKNIYLDFIKKHFLSIGFIVSLLSSLFVLVYSEIVGFLPCFLCWYQRIFMFPLVFIFGIASWYKDHTIVKYVLPLLSIGFVVSVYQNLIYYFGNVSASSPCDASGVSCYKQLISEFGGYISMPMLALSSFFSIITVVLVAHFYGREKI
ncbi:MAG: disulfide bond formation protein B [Minisyncoccia bacterium]